MKSIVSMTYEVVDMELAAEELIEGIQGQELDANSLGILFVDSELGDYRELLGALRKALSFDIIGCTTVATINREDGISEMSTSLMVLTANDCRFHAVLSQPVQKENVREVVEQAYREATGEIEGRPKMLFAIPSHNLGVMIDHYPQILTEISGGVPVFGGLSGYNAPYGVNAIVFNEKIYSNRMLLVALEGNIKPLFSVAVKLSHLTEGKHTITSSKDNVVYKIDDMTVPEYLDSIGIDPVKLAEDKTDILFVSNPLLLTAKDKTQEDYMLVRSLHALDMEEGYGVALGLVPQGHNVAIGSLNRQDITTSGEMSIRQLLDQIEAAEKADPSYKYSTIIAVSCAARYMILTPKLEAAGDVFLQNIPKHLNYTGYYSYGEFVPTSVKDGVAINTAQNESLTLCAF